MSPQQEFKTAKQLNTSVAKRLKAALKRDAKKKYAKQKKAKKAKGSGGGPHVDANQMPTGVLAKDSQYALRGHDYIDAKHTSQGGDARGGVYDQVTNRPHLKRIEKLAARAIFPDPACPKNFNPKRGQSCPYRWRAHHMLPGSAFYYTEDDVPCFTEKGIKVILRSDYNVNDGHNIIMLPTENWAVPVHEVPQHPSDHVRYTQRVMKDLNKVSKQLQKNIEQGMHEDKIAEEVCKQLRDLENDYWEFLVRMGHEAIASVIDGTDFSEDREDFVALGGKYKWGRLF